MLQGRWGAVLDETNEALADLFDLGVEMAVNPKPLQTGLSLFAVEGSG